MKRRRGRRGFWWWSWLLALTTIGATVGGFFYGKKRWEEAPKDYVASALVSVNIRKPFIARGSKEIEIGGLNANESETLRGIKSNEGLAPIVADLNLTNRWEMGTNEAVLELKSNLDLDLNRDTRKLVVTVRSHSAEEAAEIANAIARAIPDRIKSLDESSLDEAEKKLQSELRPYQTAAENARLALKEALAAKNIPIDPKPEIDMSPYIQMPTIGDAVFTWQDANEVYAETRKSQLEFATYLKRKLKPSFVETPASPPTGIAGPELRPFQVQSALYGLTSGLVLGSLLMLLCSKLFS